MTFRAGASAALIALALTLVLAACGGGESEAQVASIETTETTGTDTTTTETTPSEDPEEALLAYTRCLREHGVDIEDPQNGRLLIRPGGGGDGPPTQAELDEFREANEACADLRENLPTPQLSEEDRAEFQDALLAFAKCMRENGVDVPDPEFSEGGGAFRMGGDGRGLDPNDPDFQAAREKCEVKLRPLQERFEQRSEAS